MAREDPHIKVVHHPKNRKLGGSLRSGYAVATKELVLYSDADLPFDLLEIERAVRLLEYQQADVLSAYRFDRTSEGLRAPSTPSATALSSARFSACASAT